MVLANDMIGEQQQQSSSIHHQLQRSSSPNTSLTSSSSSPSSQAMATEQISLYELRELATRQQERIETTQRLIMNREQKLKYIKHDTLLNHSINEYDQNLQRLKDSVSAQEIKLRQLRALKGQVQKQRCSNSNLCSELESIRTLFNEKEKELSVALTKVDALTRQLEELRKGNTTNSYHINGISNGKHGIELEKLRQELLYRTKLNEQQNQDLIHKKGLLTQRQSEMVEVDKRISELQQRLARKRQLNQQLSSQMHSNISRSHGLGLGASGHHLSNSILRSSIGHPGHGHKISHMRPLSANIAAVEPMVQREQNRISEIDQHFHANKDFMGCKQDPKYQTLPYNTKFGVRQHQPLYKMTAGNHLSVSTAETDKNDYELSNDNMNDILMANISNNVLNNNNTNKSGITNKNNSSYSKLMTTKSSFVEERPSPSGSSGSSDRASIQNHNGINSLKMQQNQNNNMNGANAQHYSHQNQSQKMIGMPFVDNGNNVKQLKSVNFNSNQSASHDYSVPTTSTSSQTQSQLTSNHSKVPLNTKPKPSLPPKPSIPVKPIPPPRQTPNHSYSAQIHSDSLDNAFSMSRSNPNVDRKSTNLLTTSNTPSTSSSVSYRFPLTSLTSMTIQRPYNVINSKTGLMAQQLPHNSQHQQQQHQLNHHSYEDKIPSHSNRNTESLHQLSIGNLNESTDGPNFNGHTLTCTDLTSSTSSLSSSLSSQNNANCDTKSIVSISSTSTNTTDNNISVNSNSFSLKNESKNEINNYKNNNSSVPSVTNTSNNSSANDWHKVKRRPVVANNEIEKELALQISVASKKTSDTNLNSSVISQTQSQQFDSTVQQSIQSGNKKVGSNLSIHEKHTNIHTNQCELKPNKLDKSVEKDNNSETNLIKEQQKEELSHEPYNSNLMIENFKEKDHHCDEEHIVDNVSNHTLNKSIGASKRTKGNLKSQQMSTTTKGDRNISNSCQLSVSRRVSFDPLALLLDAALEGELELVKKTANEVPNPSAANDEGITALHNAICAGHFDIVKYLVENGCDVNAQDSDGWTPLHCAASCNNLAMVKFLVKNGACIFATTLSDQETAAEKCEEDEEGFDGCSQYLYGVQEKLGVYNGSAVYAVYDYDSQNSDEMSFREGNIIIIMRKGDEQEREWWWAKIKDREGYVPRNLLGLYPRVKSNKELQTINEEQCE